tara:strand:- start:1790 stop:1924 length:135 start_codon:yes stop_codon:yes gene_type:complete
MIYSMYESVASLRATGGELLLPDNKDKDWYHLRQTGVEKMISNF